MTPQNYYARRSAWRRQEVDVQLVLELARAERAQQPRLGVRKLYHLIGVELKQEAGGARRFCEALQAGGILAKETHENVIRFAPPLVITREEIDWAVERVRRVLS